MKYRLTVLILMGIVAWLAVPAIADDIRIPDWRGKLSTTSQVWDFGINNAGPADPTGMVYGSESNGLGLRPDGPAEGGNDPLPSTMLWVYPDADWIQIDTESGREGIWPLTGRLEVIVDNHEPPNEYKWVWLQVTWRPQSAGSYWHIHNLVPPGTTDPILIEHVDHGLGWTTSIYEWYIYPNPCDEWFTIAGDIDVDQLVVDTWCIPEPSTLAMLLGVSLMALAWRRRR